MIIGARATSKPWLFAGENPTFVSFRMSRTKGNSEAIISGTPSVDALSTTMTSSEPSFSRPTEAKQSRTTSLAPWVTMMMERSGSRSIRVQRSNLMDAPGILSEQLGPVYRTDRWGS